MNVLYEDNHLIAVEKRPGQLTQGDTTGDISLFDEVKAFIKARDKKPGNVFLGLLHRLDRPVGGVVLFAKTSKGASRLSEQIRERTVEKWYEALVEGTPPAKGHVMQWLLKDRNKNIVRAYPRPTKNALPAELFFRRISTGDVSRIEIQPTTGRPHQIRVAMASLHTPILGDVKYGARLRQGFGAQSQIALWATKLAFDHPITRKRITVHSPPSPSAAKLTLAAPLVA